MKQTAVEFLVEQLFELRNPTLNQIEIIEQAIEIKKQQKGYSEEEVLKLLLNSEEYTSRFNGRTDLKHWFEQIKKK